MEEHLKSLCNKISVAQSVHIIKGETDGSITTARVSRDKVTTTKPIGLDVKSTKKAVFELLKRRTIWVIDNVVVMSVVTVKRSLTWSEVCELLNFGYWLPT